VFGEPVEDQIAEGDRVVTRFTSRGTHKARFMGVEATGRELIWTGITIDHIVGGKIVESWANWDMLGMLQQLGIVVLPDGAQTGRT
jgi:predicted ester cyclase